MKILVSPSHRFISTFNTSIDDQGCDPNDNFTMIVHGWTEGIQTPWVGVLVEKFLRHRGGCVFVMDYSKYSVVSNYFDLVANFAGISAVLLKKAMQIGNFHQQYFFGFSFGSRLCIDAGLKITKQTNLSISGMDVCDPAGKVIKIACQHFLINCFRPGF